MSYVIPMSHLLKMWFLIIVNILSNIRAFPLFEHNFAIKRDTKSKRYVQPYVHYSFIYNSQDMEATSAHQ